MLFVIYQSYIYMVKLKMEHTLSSSLGESVALRGIDINIIVIRIVNIKTIGPILWRVRRDSRHKIKDDNQSPIKIIAPIPIVKEDISPKKKKKIYKTFKI